MGYRFIAVNFYFKTAKAQTRDMAQPLKAKTYNQKEKNSEDQASPSRGAREHFVRQ